DGTITTTIGGGVGGYTFDWSTDGTGAFDDPQDLSALGEGWYYVTASDANGCLIEDSIFLNAPLTVEITELTSPLTSGLTNISCFGFDDGTINLTAVGGAAPYSYTWSTTDGAGIIVGSEDQISTLEAGTYTITVTDQNNCSVDSTITLIEPAPLTQAITSPTYPSGDNISCFGFNDGSIDYTAGGGSPVYTYTWATADGSGLSVSIEDQTGLTAGTYTVSLVDINGCTIDTTIILVEPTPLTQSGSTFVYPSGDNISCFGLNDGSIVNYTVLGGSPDQTTNDYTYLWTIDAATTAVIPAGQELVASPTGLTAGTYNLLVTDINGCTIDTTITLIEPTPLTQTGSTFVYPSGDNISCFGENDGSIVNYTVQGGSPIPGYSYDWTVAGSGSIPAGQEVVANPAGLTAGTYTVEVTDLNGCVIDTTITLTEPAPLAQSGNTFAYPSGTNISCFGEDDGSIDMTIAGGSPQPDYTYNWTVVIPGSIPAGQNALADPSGLTAGTYSLLVTDINGCTIDTTITLVEPPLLTSTAVLSVYAGGYNLSGCAPDGSIDLTVVGGNGGFDYDWQPLGQTTEDISTLPAGLYTVTVTDINGCITILDTTLTQPPVISTTTAVTSDYNGEDISCTGASDGAVTINIVGGTPTYNFEWLNASGVQVSSIQSPGGLPAGTYTINIEDQNGCTASNTVTLVDPAPFAYDVVVATDYNGQDISCFGVADGGLDLTVSGGTPGYTYTWTDENGLVVSSIEDPNGLPSGTYEVFVTDVNGCQMDTTITLVDPPLLAGPASVTSDYNGQDVSCYLSTDGSVTVAPIGGTPGYTYSWENESGTVISTTVNASNVGEGFYTVTVTDINGCEHVTNVVVTQPTDLTATTTIISDFFGMPVSCVGATDGIVDANAAGGTPGYTYSWNSNPIQTTMQATNLGVGLYTVTVTDLNGCQDSAQVYLDANPLPELNLPEQIIGCMGNGVLLDSQSEPGSSCTWTFSDGQVFNQCGPFIANFANQDCYDMQLTVINAQGCINNASITDFVCIMPNPLAGFYADEYLISNIENGTNFWNTSQGAESYIWDFGDGSPTETTENVYHEFGPGDDFNSTNYPVTLFAISEYGCIDSATLYVTMNPDLIFYVPNAFTPDGDDYNNIFKPVFSSGYDLRNYSLMIFNRWGELIFETDQIGEGWDGTYRGNICQDGVYTWKFKVMNSITDRKEEHVGHVTLLRGEGLK
ncbi:MAG: gliding motility-associated C-terminal domain-containing protein, partial [Flavobacteriales bacterium]